MNGLEALKHLYAKLSCKSSIEEITENLQEYKTIEKELKALEIIKNKIFHGKEDIIVLGNVELTQEEYNLLKEILCQDND